MNYSYLKGRCNLDGNNEVVWDNEGKHFDERTEIWARERLN
jgi:hypothetical protein